MKIEKYLSIICFALLVSCTPVSPGVTSTNTYIEATRPALTTVAPTVFHPTVIAPTMMSHTATPWPIATDRAYITDMALDNDGNLWIATLIEVIRWNVETGEYSRYRYNLPMHDRYSDHVISLVSNSDGSVLALTVFGRIMKLIDRDWQVIIDSQDSWLGTGINKQQNGIAWISLGYYGAYQYNGKTLKRIRLPKQFICGFSSILEGNNELWAIDGVCRKQPPLLRKYDNGNWTEIKGYYPHKLKSDQQGNIWFWDSDVGVMRADLSDKIESPTKDYFSYYMDFAFAPDGSLWLMGRQDGLYHFSNGQWEHVNVGYENETITCLVVGQDNSVYIGTEHHGMFRYANSKWSQYLLNP